LEQVDAFLDRLEAHPQGKILMDSLQAYCEWFGKAPEIVLWRDHPPPRTSQASPPTRGTPWHLSLRELATCTTFEAIRKLGDVYCDLAGMPGMESDVFEAYTLNHDRKLDPALEKAWARWVAAGKQSVQDRSSIGQYRCIATRRRVIENLRIDLKQMRCYGGLTHGDFHQLIKKLRWGSDDYLPTTPTAVNLRAASLQNRHCTNFSSNDFPRELADIGPYQHKGRAGRGCASALPPLPQDLEAICLDAYPLPDLSGLPSGLKVLRIRRAGLSKLPRLPAGLKTLDVADNALTSLHGLPRLETLNISHNPLGDQLDFFAEGLKDLTADAAELTRLPVLPDTLERLSVRENYLTALPALPPRLCHLNAYQNRLTEIPEELPLTLERADFANNNLSRLPAAIANLAGCDVYLEGNPIARQDLPRLPHGMPGPRFHISIQPEVEPPHAALCPPQTPRNLTEAAEAWLLPNAPQAAQRWQALGNPVEAQEFVLFMNRLLYPNSIQESVFKTDAFRADVVSLLTELSLPERAALRADVFVLCTDATASCDDRVLWMLNQLKALLLNDDIRLGRYDNRVRDVIQAARQMFSLEVLGQIARMKVKLQALVDEVEVQLAYAVKLRQALGLTSVVPGMLFFNVSGVTQADVDSALHTVQTRQRTEFPMFLALDYAPWQTWLRRHEPDRYDAVQASLHEEMEHCLEPELLSRLRALGLDPHDDDARRTVGVPISRDIRYRILKPLVSEYLARYDDSPAQPTSASGLTAGAPRESAERPAATRP
jgi:hypothetical protein